MDLINLALQYRDYEWVKELLEQEKSELDERKGAKPDKTAEERVRTDIFTEESIALEVITSTYAVKEKNGLRAFNINSEYDRNMSDIVFVEKPGYKRGEKVNYRIPTNEEVIFARGMVNGYVMGYSEANNRLNDQLMEYFNAFETEGTKKQVTKAGKSVKARKSKVPKQ